MQASTISAIKKGQICRKSTFSHLLNIFSENIVIYYQLVSSTLEIQRSPRFTISQSQHSKSYSMSSHTSSNGLLSFISICKFGRFKKPFGTITNLPELYFRIRRFILLIQTKKMISIYLFIYLFILFLLLTIYIAKILCNICT